MGKSRKQTKGKESGDKAGLLTFGIVAAMLAAAVLLMVIGTAVQKGSATPTPTPTLKDKMESQGYVDMSAQYGAGLAEDGLLADTDASSYVTLCDYRAIVIPEEETSPEAYVLSYLLEHCEVEEYANYRESIQERILFALTYEYEYQNENLKEAYGEEKMYDSIYDSFSMTEEEFNRWVEEAADKEMRKFLILETIYRQEGLLVTEKDIRAWILSQGFEETEIEGIIYRHGMPYLTRMAMEDVVLRWIVEQTKSEN